MENLKKFFLWILFNQQMPTCTGVAGGALVTVFPCSLYIDLTLAQAVPATRNAPGLRVPLSTRHVATW